MAYIFETEESSLPTKITNNYYTMIRTLFLALGLLQIDLLFAQDTIKYTRVSKGILQNGRELLLAVLAIVLT